MNKVTSGKHTHISTIIYILHISNISILVVTYCLFVWGFKIISDYPMPTSPNGKLTSKLHFNNVQYCIPEGLVGAKRSTGTLVDQRKPHT